MYKKMIGAAVMVAMIGCTADDADPGSTDLTMEDSGPAASVNDAQAVRSARATLRNAVGGEVGSVVMREETSGGVTFEYRLTSAGTGEHGFHVHEVGSCVPPGFESAGDHFNPDNRAHGREHPEGPHAGDLPNVESDASGASTGTFRNQGLSLRPGAPNALLGGDGAALVVHAEPDDHESQPAGDAGDRIACGVIEAD